MKFLTSETLRVSKMRCVCNFITMLAPCIVLLCAGAYSQSGAGSIQGTVTDSTGAVIPKAAIHVVNSATGVATDTESNNVGFYQVPSLFTGTYSVTVSAPGMKTAKATVELQVAQAAVFNPTLTPGAVTQQVEVQANLVQLTTTENGTISNTLENERINQIPMNGRTLYTLTGLTTPGLEASGNRANGLFGEALEYVADGAPLVNRQFGGSNVSSTEQVQLPDPDAVQEVRLETSGLGAQFATPGVAIITTKSGTNSLHGSFFETARNNAVGIAKGRQNPSNYAAPHLVRNEFGASAGGPIILPKLYHGKDKSFWFFAYERYSLSQTSDELSYVPTQAMRSGDFSGLVNSAGILQQLYDPMTTTYNPTGGPNGSWPRTPFLNNQIPQNREAPMAKTLLDITPLPTSADNPLITSNYTAPDNNFIVIPTITARLDHYFSEKSRAYLRYTQNVQTNTQLRNYPSNTPATIAADGFPAGASGYTSLPMQTYSAAIGYTHVFSPTFYSETVVSQMWQGQYDEGGGNPSLDYEQMLGLPNNFGESGFPAISGLIMPYGGTQFNYQQNTIVSNIDENLTKTIGRQQLYFGGRYRHERFSYLPSRYSDQAQFSAEATALENPASGTNYSGTPNTGYADGDFFLGAVSNYIVDSNAPRVHYHDMEFDTYFQDDYHWTKNLTLNIGLRYEAHPAPWTKYGLTAGFDLKNDAIVMSNPISYYVTNGYTTQAIVNNLKDIGVVFETAAEAGFPSAMFDNFDREFSPRVGIAYSPFNGKYGTVVRGAYGRYIYPVPIRNYIQNGVTEAPYTAGYNMNYTVANQSPDGLPNYLMRSEQTVVAGANSTNVVDTTSTTAILPGANPGPTMWSMDPDYKPDEVTEMNATVEQPVKGNSALRVSWVWTHGSYLDHAFYYNNHPSTFVWEMMTGTAVPTGSVIGSNQYAATATGPYNQTTYGSNGWDEKTGWSNDNSLQINYQRLFHRGFAYQAYYVWSKAFRIGGNVTRDSTIDTPQGYLGVSGIQGTMTQSYGEAIAPALPPARPADKASYTDYHALDVFEQYQLDSAIPLQHYGFNGIVDMPFGRGKKFFGNSNRFIDEIVGGFQIAGDGNIISQNFQVANGNWGATNPIHVYKHKAPIMDCRSGVCHKAYEWFNGYLAPTVVPSNPFYNQGCKVSSNNVTGLPSGWAPYSLPIDNDCNPSDAANEYYGQNAVDVTLSNGSVLKGVGYSPGPLGSNPYSHTFLNGPINWTADLSLFKVFPITEHVNLRVNVDAFNALNVQGYNNPNTTDGTEQVQPGVGVASSYNTPRQIQFTMRLTF